MECEYVFLVFSSMKQLAIQLKSTHINNAIAKVKVPIATPLDNISTGDNLPGLSNLKD